MCFLALPLGKPPAQCNETDKTENADHAVLCGYLDRSSKFHAMSAHNRMYTSRHGSLHSLAPSQLLIHSTPSPVHSVLKSTLRLNSSMAAPARSAAVSLTVDMRKDACSALPLRRWPGDVPALGSGLGRGDERCRGSNQLL